jgi:S-formylglutathione hydrolase
MSRWFSEDARSSPAWQGGMGALVAFLRSAPGTYQSVSALAPVGHPTSVEGAPAWRAFAAYLGDAEANRATWRLYDASELLTGYRGRPISLLVDQGEADPKRKLLASEDLVPAAASNPAISLTYRMHPGYDHELLHFVATFVDEHLAYHATRLGCVRPRPSWERKALGAAVVVGFILGAAMARAVAARRR